MLPSPGEAQERVGTVLAEDSQSFSDRKLAFRSGILFLLVAVASCSPSPGEATGERPKIGVEPVPAGRGICGSADATEIEIKGIRVSVRTYVPLDAARLDQWLEGEPGFAISFHGLEAKELGHFLEIPNISDLGDTTINLRVRVLVRCKDSDFPVRLDYGTSGVVGVNGEFGIARDALPRLHAVINNEVRAVLNQ